MGCRRCARRRCCGFAAARRWHGRVWPIYAVLVGIGLGRAFSGPAAQRVLPSLVPKEHFVNAVTWGATVFQIANIAGAGGGRTSVHAAAGGRAGAVEWRAGGVCLHAGDAAGVPRAGRHDPDAAVQAEKKAFNLETMLAGLRLCVAGEAAAGVDLAGSVCGAAGRRDGAAADLCDGHSACRAAWAGAAAGDAVAGRAGGFADDDGEADQAEGGQADAGLRGDLWRGDGGVRVVAEYLAELVALVVVGASDMVSVVVRSSILQLATPPEMRGRVSAVNWLFIGASNEFGEFESGVTAQWWGAVRAVVIGGIGSMVVTARLRCCFPALRNADALTAESLMEPNVS